MSIKIVLIHFSTEFPDEETQTLLELAKNFKTTSFIVAHSFFGFGGNIHKIIEQSNPESPPSNIYIGSNEQLISPQFWDAENKEKMQQLVSAWKSFGINKIVYESDSSPTLTSLDNPNPEYMLDWFVDNELLEPKDARLILQKNGEELLKKLELY